MFSNIDWSNLYGQARQMWTLFAADTLQLGRTFNQVFEASRPQWNDQRYAPQYATVRVVSRRRPRRY
ncbi:MAG: hypothetical protein IT329_03525 [Caldilineaceae bacterium]|nr:hypothetical protein [Caldilineaceae bacterium]